MTQHVPGVEMVTWDRQQRSIIRTAEYLRAQLPDVELETVPVAASPEAKDAFTAALGATRSQIVVVMAHGCTNGSVGFGPRRTDPYFPLEEVVPKGCLSQARLVILLVCFQSEAVGRPTLPRRGWLAAAPNATIVYTSGEASNKNIHLVAAQAIAEFTGATGSNVIRLAGGRSKWATFVPS